MRRVMLCGVLLFTFACQPNVSGPSRFVTIVSSRDVRMENGFDMKKEETRYIDLEKNRQRTETTSFVEFGALATQKTTTQIFDGARIYTLNPSMPNHALYFGGDDDVDFGHHKIWEYPTPGEQYFKGEESLLGRTVRRYELPNKSVWLWNGIALKEEYEVDGLKTITEPVSIEENKFLSDDLFTLPANVKPVSMKEMSDSLGKTTP